MAQDYRETSVEPSPDSLEVRAAEVYLVVSWEQNDAICIQFVKRICHLIKRCGSVG